MNVSKKELLAELNSHISTLKAMQKSHTGILKYLPEDLKKVVKEGMGCIEKNESVNTTDDKEPPMPQSSQTQKIEEVLLPCNNEYTLQNWFTQVGHHVDAAKSVLEKGSQNYFKQTLAKEHAGSGSLPNTINDLADFLFGSLCAQIAKSNSITFSDAADMLPLFSTKAHFAHIAMIWESTHSECLTLSHLPKPDFLAKQLMSLYIESSLDGFDVDPGEYTKIKAGYIYFFIKGNYEVVYAAGDNGFLEGTVEFIDGKFDYAPVLDDVYGGSNAIKVLKELYGANAKLVDLPIKLKLNAQLTLADPMDFYGGLPGFNTLIFDRDMSGHWVGSSEGAKKWDEAFQNAEKKAKRKLNLTDFIENYLLSDFTLANLISDGW